MFRLLCDICSTYISWKLLKRTLFKKKIACIGWVSCGHLSAHKSNYITIYDVSSTWLRFEHISFGYRSRISHIVGEIIIYELSIRRLKVQYGFGLKSSSVVFCFIKHCYRYDNISFLLCQIMINAMCLARVDCPLYWLVTCLSAYAPIENKIAWFVAIWERCIGYRCGYVRKWASTITQRRRTKKSFANHTIKKAWVLHTKWARSMKYICAET